MELLSFTAMAIAMVEVYHTHLPVWGVIPAVLAPAFYMVPCGIIQGITNVDANQVNVLAEFAAGYMFSGKPLANMIFKILSVDTVGKCLYFAQDMKLAHYSKIPNRTLFFAQGSATVSSSSPVRIRAFLLITDTLFLGYRYSDASRGHYMDIAPYRQNLR